jgi:hypothetical protein
MYFFLILWCLIHRYVIGIVEQIVGSSWENNGDSGGSSCRCLMCPYFSGPIFSLAWLSPTIYNKIGRSQSTQRILFFLTSLFLNDERKSNREDSNKMTRECVETLKYKRIMCLSYEIYIHTICFESWSIEQLTYLF